jgi:hypothetical protein
VRAGLLETNGVGEGPATTLRVLQSHSPQLISVTLARCLRTIDLPSHDGRHVFDRMYYLEELTNLGERIAFLDSAGPLVAVLNFRRVYRV